jgi:hypothetical protein
MSLGLPQRVTHVGPNPRVYPPFRHANISGPQTRSIGTRLSCRGVHRSDLTAEPPILAATSKVGHSETWQSLYDAAG